MCQDSTYSDYAGETKYYPEFEIEKKKTGKYVLIGVLALLLAAAAIWAICRMQGSRGYYVSESGVYAVSLEKNGECFWYQAGLRFEGTYEEFDDYLQLSLKGKSHYIDTVFKATREGKALRIIGGTVDNELFVKTKKPDDVKALDKAAKSENSAG